MVIFAPPPVIADTNPIIPEINELFYAAVSFFALWALMKWVFLPPITGGMQRRADKIREDLAAADRDRQEAAQVQVGYDQQLASARAEASRIVDDARARAEEQRREIMAEAEAEIGRQRTEAAEELAAAKRRALEELRGSLSTIAVSAAEAVVQKRLDEAEQRRIVEEYVNRVASTN